jgi:hypothetical protein
VVVEVDGVAAGTLPGHPAQPEGRLPIVGAQPVVEGTGPGEVVEVKVLLGQRVHEFRVERLPAALGQNTRPFLELHRADPHRLVAVADVAAFPTTGPEEDFLEEFQFGGIPIHEPLPLLGQARLCLGWHDLLLSHGRVIVGPRCAAFGRL